MIKTETGIILYKTRSGRKYRWHMHLAKNGTDSKKVHRFMDTGTLCKFLYMVADEKMPEEKAWKKC